MSDSSNLGKEPTANHRLVAAYRECKDLARQTARNFYYAFLVLPRSKQQAMCALYAFMRGTDDLGDNDKPLEVRRQDLTQWRRQLDDALLGHSHENWWLALSDTVKRYNIQPETLHDVVDGVASDLDTFRYQTFNDLYKYCYRVASAVGLACIRVWGAVDKRSELPAEWCGIAFQLTNVLRDVVEDYDRGRLYIPQEDLDRFGVDESVFKNRQATPEFVELMRFQVARARDYYQRSRELTRYLPASGRAVYAVMQGLYEGLLDKIEAAPERVLQGRIRLSTAHKIRCLLAALPIRYLGGLRPAGSNPVL